MASVHTDTGTDPNWNRHGFMENGEKELEEGTTEYIAKLIRVEENVQLDEKPMLRKIIREDV